MAESSTAINTDRKNIKSFKTNNLVYNISSKNIKPTKTISKYIFKKTTMSLIIVKLRRIKKFTINQLVAILQEKYQFLKLKINILII